MTTTPTPLTTFEQVMTEWNAMWNAIREENRRLKETVQEQGKIIDRLDAKLADACLGKEDLTAMLDEVRERNQELVIENQRLKEDRDLLHEVLIHALGVIGGYRVLPPGYWPPRDMDTSVTLLQERGFLNPPEDQS